MSTIGNKGWYDLLAHMTHVVSIIRVRVTFIIYQTGYKPEGEKIALWPNALATCFVDFIPVCEWNGLLKLENLESKLNYTLFIPCILVGFIVLVLMQKRLKLRLERVKCIKSNIQKFQFRSIRKMFAHNQPFTLLCIKPALEVCYFIRSMLFHQMSLLFWKGG